MLVGVSHAYFASRFSFSVNYVLRFALMGVVHAYFAILVFPFSAANSDARQVTVAAALRNVGPAISRRVPPYEPLSRQRPVRDINFRQLTTSSL